MKIDVAGDGLGITIECEYLYGHNWMAFASWYSITQNLPDAKVLIVVKRGIKNDILFSWTYKRNIPCFLYTENYTFATNKWLNETKKQITISPVVMAVREYMEPLSIVSAYSDETATFVNYSPKCGKLVVDEWKDKNDIPPFRKAYRRFDNGNLTNNEIKILNIMDKANASYKDR